ncbi:alpha/beta hydrolase [Moorena sp. SIO4G3]|uniref:alpha/beta hydrolase n=1 Tax=Moorena sp. SIO4G3 TaxID=2607821 RepID=UPI00142A3038|nr:alpha/beta hydrolase [Moorena sp. SIO4G3]NEO80940.1 alpha/beta hydrolase [Moorena sp. SIO4G3]
MFRFAKGKLQTRLRWLLLNLGLLITPVMISAPVEAAEKIYISYGPIEFSLPIAALEVYATVGKVEPSLAFYAGYVKPEEFKQLRQVLITPIDVTPVAIAQFLYSPQGEIILQRVGEVIQTKARQPGFYAIRAALIKAAFKPEGLTILNVLQEFPTYGIRINSQRGFEIIDDLSKLIKQTQTAITAVEQASEQEAAAQTERALSEKSLDLRQPGSVSYAKQTITFDDHYRRREFPVDLYLPESPREGLAPVIVISHGLGSVRKTFEYLAHHLASHGFAVAVPEHPGSNADQIQALLTGLAKEAAPPSEFINRPVDIKLLLDELESSFKGQLNLQQVGVLGQSFGGYTSLALAGAEINFEQLQKDCAPLNEDTLNISLLLQCRAFDLPPQDYQLSDQRIKGAIAINPIASTVLGKSQLSQIQVPLMVVAGSDDTIAPALPEQIQPFTWLTTLQKYLVLLKRGTHFSTLAPSEDDVPLPEAVVGPDPTIAQEYMKALSLAFFQTYIAGKSEYQAYLSAAYAQSLSQELMPLSLLTILEPLVREKAGL